MKICLIADDAPIVRKVAARILKLNKYHVEAPETVRDMIATCRANMPDLVIVAETFGDEDGLGLVQRIRDLPDGNVPTILICTSANSIALRSRSRRCGANGVLMKPFTRETVDGQLRRLGLANALLAA